MMADNEIGLIEATVELFDTWRDFVADYHAVGEEDICGIGSMDGGCATRTELAAAVERLQDHAKGIGFKKEWVPASTYWLVRDGRILGTCNLRHRLNEYLRKFGGHIGYSIRKILLRCESLDTVAPVESMTATDLRRKLLVRSLVDTYR